VRTSRIVLLITTVLGMLLATFVFTTATASANARSCNGSVCITVSGNGTWVERVTATANNAFNGHFEVHGPTYHYNTGDRYWNAGNGTYLSPRRHMPDGSRLCLTGWNWDGSWRQVGTACVWITI
jgi:hypothetical protein